MAREIVIEFERGGTVAAELLEEKAPKTCRAVLKALPSEHPMIHAMWAGEEIFFDGVPLPEHLEFENETNEVEPGDVAVIATPGHRGLAAKGITSFCIFYGKSRPRKGVDQTVDVNVFAKIRSLEEITRISRRIRKEGAEKARIRLRGRGDA
jgi:hypothetical protein